MSFDFELINADLKIKADGTIRTVTDTPKLRQDILKMILTPLGTNRFHKWYGCTVAEDIIGKNMPENLVITEIQSAVTTSLEKLKALQQTQSVSQKVSLAEMIAEIGGVWVERDPTDLRLINVIVTVYSRRLTKVEELFTLTS